MMVASGPPVVSKQRGSMVRKATIADGPHADAEDHGPAFQRHQSHASHHADHFREHEEATLPMLDFVDGHEFHTLISALIGANVLVLMAETDYPHWIGWGLVDAAFALVFLLEIVLRMAYRGIHAFFLKDMWWGILDLTIVVLGLFDALIEPLVRSGGLITRASGHSSFFQTVRLVRLLRMLRFVKLFPKLMSFVQGLVEMFSTMIWIFTFLTLVMVCLAIIMTRELGRQDPDEVSPATLIEEEQEMAAHVAQYFQDVPTTLFTLFRVSTQDDWMTIAGPLVEGNPAWSIFFIGFIVFVSWTMISVLTAVASESMVAATVDRKEQELREADEKAKAFIEFLRDAFKKADADGNGLLDKEEFETMMKKEFVAHQMRSMGFTMSEDEMLKSWDMLDIERKGELTIDSFVSGLSYLQEKLTTRHVMSISYLLKRVQRRLEHCIRDLVTELDALSDQNKAIVQCMDRQDKLADQQHLNLWLWYQWMRKYDAKVVKDVNPIRPAALQETPAAVTPQPPSTS